MMLPCPGASWSQVKIERAETDHLPGPFCPGSDVFMPCRLFMNQSHIDGNAFSRPTFFTNSIVNICQHEVLIFSSQRRIVPPLHLVPLVGSKSRRATRAKRERSPMLGFVIHGGSGQTMLYMKHLHMLHGGAVFGGMSQTC